MELLKQYREEIARDLVIDDFNIKGVQTRLPARRHFWVARLIDAKIELNNLKKKQKTLRSTIVQKIINESPLKVTQTTAEIAADKTEDMQGIADSIKEYEFLVEYLERVEKIMSSMSFDIKNIIEVQKLEQL